MRKIGFRPAERQDAVSGAELMMETLHEFGVYLFGFGDRSRATAALEKFFSLPGNRFSFQHAEFAVNGGRIIGLLMTFDRRKMRMSMAATAGHMLRVYKPKELLKFLKLMLPYRDEEDIPADELYIGHLAVCDEFRRQGVGFEILEHVEKNACRRGLPKLSLLTEIENTPAQALYRKFGFKVTDTILFPEQMAYVGSKGDVRMVKILH